MAQAILAIAQVVGAAYSATVGFVASGLVAVGVPAAAAQVAAGVAVDFAVNAAVAVTASFLFRPNIPDAQFAKLTKRQPIPDRVSGYGRARIGGATMLYEAVGNTSYNVYALHDGAIGGFVEFYLNDDLVTFVSGEPTHVEAGSDGRYGGGSGDGVYLETRQGLPTETVYTRSNTGLPTIWPTNATGDGIASLEMVCIHGKKEEYLGQFPNGLPEPSVVADLQYVWDARLGARGTITDDADKIASPTWVGGSRNPVWQLLDYLTNPVTGRGYELDRFLPRIDDWILAADVCDEAVPLFAGGTEPRYQAGGVYLHSTAEADVVATILACMDGWLSQDTMGRFTVQAGTYYEPTVVFEERHIIGMSVNRWQEDERAVNEIVVSFTDPGFGYTEVETDPLQNTADIAARGEVRSQRLSLPWVQNNSQAQRLRKIGLAKASAPLSGTLTTTLDGLRAFDQRRVRIQNPSDSTAMADIVVDILPITLNPDYTVSIPWKSCDETAYDWNAAAEEGAGPGGEFRPPAEMIATPVILSAELVGDRIYVTLEGPISPSYTVQLGWSAVDGDPIGDTNAPELIGPDGGGDYLIVTSAGVPDDEDINVYVAFIAASGAIGPVAGPYVVGPVDTISSILGADLYDYWDAAEASTITQSSGTVSEWRSFVNAYPAQQATSGARPAYAATGINGAPSINFDGTDDELTYAGVGTFPTGAAASEVWALIDHQASVADTAAKRIFAYGGITTNDARGVRRAVVSGANVFSTITGTGAANVTASAPGDFTGVHVGRCEFSATTSTASLDGTAGTGASAVPATATTRTRIGASTTTPVAAFGLFKARMIIVTAPLSAPKAAALLAHMKTLGGIP